MIRSSGVLTVAVAVVLALAGGAHAQRCPYLAQHQLQIQIQMRMQMQMQRQQAMQRFGQGRPPGAFLRQPPGGNELLRMRQRMERTTVNIHRIQRSMLQREMSLITIERRRSLEEPRPLPGPPDLMRRLEQIRRERTKLLTQTRTSITAEQKQVAQQRQRIFRAASSQVRTLRTSEQSRMQAIRLDQDNRAKALQGEANKRARYQHSANVRARMTTNFTCGRCHRCAGGSTPSIVQNGPRLPAQQGGNNPPPAALAGKGPRLPALQGPAPAAWLPGPVPGRIVRVPAPAAGPRPGAVLLQPPLLQLPDLPPIGIVRLDPPAQPAGERAAPGKAIAGEAKKKPAKIPGLALDQPPPLPRLEGSIVLLGALEGSKDSLAQQARTPRSELLPEDVVQAPRLAPLPGLRAHDRGLLPTLDSTGTERDAFDLAARPSALELVLQPPPLPDIFLR
jgi:hypothetical protein